MTGSAFHQDMDAHIDNLDKSEVDLQPPTPQKVYVLVEVDGGVAKTTRTSGEVKVVIIDNDNLDINIKDFYNELPPSHKPCVVIEVNGGCARVVKTFGDVEVSIMDWDKNGFDNLIAIDHSIFGSLLKNRR